MANPYPPVPYKGAAAGLIEEIAPVPNTATVTRRCCGKPLTFTVRHQRPLNDEEMAGWKTYYENMMCPACEEKVILAARRAGRLPSIRDLRGR